jgi:hypothetical protein
MHNFINLLWTLHTHATHTHIHTGHIDSEVHTGEKIIE